MKRFMVLLIALTCLAFVATPAFAAQGTTRNGDHVCFGGSDVVGSDETPNSVVLFGCGARIQSGARVQKDVVSFGGDVVIEQGADITGDVVVFGGNLDIAGHVGHRVTSFGPITLEPSAVVGENVDAFGRINQKPGATVRGRVNSGNNVTIGPRIFPTPFVYVPSVFDTGAGLIFGALRALVATLALIALGALVLVFLPTQTQQVAATAERAALPSLGVGCLTFLVVPSLIILFVITCLGIPLGVILGIAFGAAVLLGWIAIGMIVGDRLLRALKTTTIVPMLAMLVGLLVLWIITQLPILGGLIGLFVATLALGAVVLTRFGTQPYPQPMSAAMTPFVPPAPPAPPVPPATPPAPVDTGTSS